MAQRDQKFVSKMKLLNSIKVFHALLKEHVNNSKTLLALLLIIKTLARNSKRLLSFPFPHARVIKEIKASCVCLSLFSLFCASAGEGWHLWHIGKNVHQCRLHATLETENVNGLLQTFNEQQYAHRFIFVR